MLTGSAHVTVFTADSLQPTARISAPGLAAALATGVSFTAISAMPPPAPHRPPTIVLATGAGQVRLHIQREWPRSFQIRYNTS